jgi:endoglucanase
LARNEVAADGRSSGVKDDMWAFTSRNPRLDLRAATMFAAASRALKGYNDDLSARALVQSKRLLKEATDLLAKQPQDNAGLGGGQGEYGNQSSAVHCNRGAAICHTGSRNLLWPALDRNVSISIATAMDAIPHMNASFKEKLRPYVVKYKAYIDSLEKDNPYGVPYCAWQLGRQRCDR